MIATQLKVVLGLSLLSLAGGCAWLWSSPGFEPALFIVVGLAGLFSIWWPKREKKCASKRLRDRVSFDYSNNNGRYIIGEGEMVFETAWSKADGDSIHIYSDPPSIHSLAIADGAHRIADVSTVDRFDFSSRSRTPEEGDVVIVRNKFGNYGALRIVDVKDQNRSDAIDEVTFEYVLNPGGDSDFR